MAEPRSTTLFLTAIFGLFIVLSFALPAFAVPPSSPGSGPGAIGVDAAWNVSIGTSTPSSSTKVLIVASSTASTAYALQVVQPSGNQLFFVRNDGKTAIGGPIYGSTNTLSVTGNVSITGTLTASSTSGVFAGSIAAGNIIPGVFAPGSGNFAFRSSLGIGTSSAAGLPATLSVYGNISIATSVILAEPSAKATTTVSLSVSAEHDGAGEVSLNFAADMYAEEAHELILFQKSGDPLAAWAVGHSSRGGFDPDSFSIFANVDAASSSQPTPRLTAEVNSKDVGIGMTDPQSGFHVPDGKYFRAEKTSQGSPVSLDCDSDTEYGRLTLDTANNALWLCTGVSGWRYGSLND